MYKYIYMYMLYQKYIHSEQQVTATPNNTQQQQQQPEQQQRLTLPAGWLLLCNTAATVPINAILNFAMTLLRHKTFYTPLSLKLILSFD